MNKFLVFAIVALAGCGGRISVPAENGDEDNAGGDSDASTTIIECTEESPSNFVCSVPSDQVLNVILQGEQGVPGLQGLQGDKGNGGEMGPPGPAGQDANSCLYLTIDELDHQGQCLFVGNDIWVEHEGGKVDVYNNSDCDHGPAPREAYCNDLGKNEVCWAGTSRIEVVKDGLNWKVYKLNVAPECVQDSSN